MDSKGHASSFSSPRPPNMVMTFRTPRKHISKNGRAFATQKICGHCDFALWALFAVSIHWNQKAISVCRVQRRLRWLSRVNWLCAA